jgi:hypothetical protein
LCEEVLNLFQFSNKTTTTTTSTIKDKTSRTTTTTSSVTKDTIRTQTTITPTSSQCSRSTTIDKLLCNNPFNQSTIIIGNHPLITIRVTTTRHRPTTTTPTSNNHIKSSQLLPFRKKRSSATQISSVEAKRRNP